jgi:hypothetical protein
MAVYTDLGTERLAELIAAYDVGDLVSAKGIAEGVSNSNWLIETSGKDGGPRKDSAQSARFILTMYERRIETADLPFFLDLLDAVHDVDYAFVNATPHEVKCPHALPLIFHFRVNLGISTKPNTTSQMIHCEEVVFPSIIQNLKKYRPFHSLHLSSRCMRLFVATSARCVKRFFELVEARY